MSSVAACIPPPKEVIVVADGDTDGSWRVAEEYGARVLRIPTSGGPARARNLGAAEAKGDILFFVDADVTVPQDAISQVAGAFQDDPGLSAIFGSYDDAPFETNFLSQYKNLFHYYMHQNAKEEAKEVFNYFQPILKLTNEGLIGYLPETVSDEPDFTQSGISDYTPAAAGILWSFFRLIVKMRS